MTKPTMGTNHPNPAMAAISPPTTRSAPIASHRKPALTTRTGVLHTVTRDVTAARGGAPQLGQAVALSETSFPHSEHMISAIVVSIPSNDQIHAPVAWQFEFKSGFLARVQRLVTVKRNLHKTPKRLESGFLRLLHRISHTRHVQHYCERQPTP